MTKGNEISSAPANANDAHARAVDWLLERRDSEAWNEQDEAKLDAWLAESSANLIAYWRAESGIQRTELLSALRPFRSQQASFSASRGVRWPFSKIAASALILALLGVTYVYFASPHYTTYATSVGGHKTLTLRDGSQIELNTNTVVRVAVNTDQRNVILDKGEAYFQVKHNPKRTFVVNVGAHRITDLGTKFLVRRSPGKVEVSLLEGLARFDAERETDKLGSLTLTPGDVAIATRDSLFVTRKPTAELASELSWRQGVLVFRHTTLAEAAGEFNRYNDQKLVIDDPAVARLEIRGTFRTADIALFARIARKALRLRLANRGDNIVITQ